MLDQKLINKINTIYNLGGEVEFLSVVEKGFLSENYILKNKHKKFFLKKYRSIGLERLKETHAIKKFFSENGIPVVMPIYTNAKKTFFLWDGAYYSLFPFVDGKQINVDKLNKKEIESCAELLAKIHLVTENKCPKLVKERSFGWDKKDSLKRAKYVVNLIKNKKVQSAFDKKVIKYLLQKIELIGKNKIRYQELGLKNNHLIHGDFHEDNIFFDKKGGIIGIFDWEKNNQSPRVLELVRAMWFLCFYDRYDGSAFKRAQIFLSKYNNVYPISKDELRRGIIAWHLNQLHSMWVVDEVYLKSNKRVKILMNSYINFLNYQSRNLEKFFKRISNCF
ncbi:MAG: hypothetical protein ACD_7C00505G0004 [uncultured bacterium]|nr:MAG: hypothetical protein ACD_7C00505G0004 [uncultured bacterium]HBR79560.1 hypothetical protein [Candidatus Moranbacteria bacterium]